MSTSRTFFKRVLGLISGAVFLLFPLRAFAADGTSIAMTIIQIFWWIALAASVGLFIYGFVLLRTRQEDLVEISRAKKIILFSAIGAIVSLIVILILWFIAGRMSQPQDIQANIPVDQPALSPRSGFTPLGQFSKIASTYPARDERGVPRNISILITFTEPIQLASVSDDHQKLLPSAIDIQQVAFTKKDAKVPFSARVELAANDTILKIIPDAPMGIANQKTQYLASLKPAIKKSNGESLFGSTGGYAWGFEVSGVSDNTPPAVESVLPIPGAEARVPKNALIQITFTKPIDPAVIQGNKLQVQNVAKGTNVEGVWRFGNNYRSVSFFPAQKCSKNTCNDTVYCLPENTPIKVVVQSATLQVQKNPETPNRAKSPYDGIVDVAGNSLDGGGDQGLKKNGKSEGPPNDNYIFSAQTSDELRQSLPQITRIEPGRDATGVVVDVPIKVNFSTFMDLTSIHNGSALLSQDVSSWVSGEHHPKERYTSIVINHDPLKAQTLYSPQITADVHDAYQNCFNPCVGPR